MMPIFIKYYDSRWIEKYNISFDLCIYDIATSCCEFGKITIKGI